MTGLDFYDLKHLVAHLAAARTSEANRYVTEIQDPEWRLNALAGGYGSDSSSEQWLNAVEAAVSVPVRSTRLAHIGPHSPTPASGSTSLLR